MFQLKLKCMLQEYVGKTLVVAEKGVDVTVSNFSQVVLPDRGAMTPPNTGTPTPARNLDHDVPTDPRTGGQHPCTIIYTAQQTHRKPFGSTVIVVEFNNVLPNCMSIAAIWGSIAERAPVIPLRSTVGVNLVLL